MIKYLRIASDLHLEGYSGRNPETLVLDFLPPDDRDGESILVLAGDISSHADQLVNFIQACQSRFVRVIFVPGNHEYYKHNYTAWNSEMADRFERYCPGLVYALDKVETFEIPGTRFIIGTLWADGGPQLLDQAQVGFYLNDFRLIQIDTADHPHHMPNRRFTVQDMMAIHTAQKKSIEEALTQPFDGKTAVITHHLPSRRLVSERFWPRDGSDGANGGFASNCDNMICTLEPWLWVHGHTHDTIDTELWETRIVCNPAGYRGEYATRFNTFMTSDLREDGTKRAIVVPKFVEL